MESSEAIDDIIDLPRLIMVSDLYPRNLTC